MHQTPLLEGNLHCLWGHRHSWLQKRMKHVTWLKLNRQNKRLCIEYTFSTGKFKTEKQKKKKKKKKKQKNNNNNPKTKRKTNEDAVQSSNLILS